MTTVRVCKHERNFTIIQNEAIQDKTLSLKARGLHHLLLSYPNDWIINVKHLANQSDKDGPDAIKTGLKELEEAGYLEREQSRSSGKFATATYVIYEISQNPCEQGLSTVSGFPVSGFDVDGKPHDILSTISTKDFSKKDPFRSGFSPKNPETEKGINPLEEETPKPAKPKPLFNGTQPLGRSERGWIQLPQPLTTVAGHRERIGLINAQAIVWAKDALVNTYAEILGVHKPTPDTINGPTFSTMHYNEFLNADGPMPFNQMRAALVKRVSGFQDIFNELVERLFWMSWRKFTG
jgi:hypothetical protein